MYIRKVKTKNKKTGVDYFTYKLVKNQRINGIPTQINLLSLGSLEDMSNNEINLLAKRIEEIYTHDNQLYAQDYPKQVEELAHFFTKKLLQKDFVARKPLEADNEEHSTEKNFVEIDINSITTKISEQIGGEFLCKQAINELGLEDFLTEKLSFTQIQLNHSMLALTGRLVHPTSESQTARWLNENSAAIDFHPLDSGKVNKNQLYSAANQLYEHKNEIEAFMNLTTEKILHLKRKIILYDLTNFHFEGQIKNSKKAAYGKNKQKRYDCKQITLGMLTDDNGFPTHTEYFKGNISEPSTLEGIITDLTKNTGNLFSGEKPCIIMDAGIATEDNLKYLLKNGYEYVCVSRGEHKDLIDKVEEAELVKFKNKSEKELSAQLFKQDFAYEDSNNTLQTISESVIYIKSPDKEKKEVAIDENKCKRFEEGLKKIEYTINNPKGRRSIPKIHERIGRLKEKNKGITGFFDIEMEDDKINIVSINWKRNENVPKTKTQGVYFLRTNISEKSEEKLWHVYRIANEIEEAFGTIKSDLKARPNFHHKDSTIEAHLNLCVLAYYIVNFIRYKLKAKNITHSWTEICRIMSTQHRTIQVSRTKDDKALWTKTCTVPNPQVVEIYQALGYKKIPYYRKSVLI